MNSFNFGFRQRGRPKLIGDDLDAELVDYIVELKKQKNLNLTAQSALFEAKNYIQKRQPELLFENGGPVNLKTTWAMKLVTRVNEKYAAKYGPEISGMENLNGSWMKVMEMMATDENAQQLFSKLNQQ